jgi:hypothetical protein
LGLGYVKMVFLQLFSQDWAWFNSTINWVRIALAKKIDNPAQLAA